MELINRGGLTPCGRDLGPAGSRLRTVHAKCRYERSAGLVQLGFARLRIAEASSTAWYAMRVLSCW